ncbi:glycoside hydrolase family 13 protein [Lactovum miscens]|uniref:Glycosidase n=2 Tax=Lactovum miscens TaxID=190387 RepID=A0A841C4Z8_9LACT|nr:glycoside hydrolase family 13 protein [Lactovum miscens]MBB5887505.1 glycosidase [Lactovum miscens]
MYSYNPWKIFHKEPFGAVRNNQLMRIRFVADGDVSVKMVIHRDFGTPHEFEMLRIDERTFETVVTFDHGHALYFYHFEIVEQSDWGGRRLYYSSSLLGGEGYLVEDAGLIRPFQVTVFDGEDETPDWYKNSIFYQIFPDRFFNGNLDSHINAPKANSFLYAQESDDPFYIKDIKTGEIARWDFYGGNIKGIIAKIPYLKELGVNALYLNPIFLSKSNHRYDTLDYMRIDPVLGTEADFQKLVDKLHENGMHIILDGVFSHVGDDSEYFNRFGTFGKELGAAQSKESPYYEWFKFINWPEDYKTWWGFKNMPEVDKNSPSFQQFIYGGKESVLSKWNEFGIDGWRIDVADELPDSFIRGIRKNLTDTDGQKVLIGEVWEDASNKLAYNQRRNYILGEALQGVMNYPLRDLIINYVLRNISAEEVASQLMTLRENYPKSIFYGNLNNIGSHDTERILTMVGEKSMDIAIGMMFVMPGVPTIYYGDEAGMTGNKDPENRKFFPWNDIHEPFYTLYHYWAHERLENEALKTGDFNVGFVGNCLAILRCSEHSSSIYIANPNESSVTINPVDIIFLRDHNLYEDLSLIGVIEIASKFSCLKRF